MSLPLARFKQSLTQLHLYFQQGVSIKVFWLVCVVQLKVMLLYSIALSLIQITADHPLILTSAKAT